MTYRRHFCIYLDVIPGYLYNPSMHYKAIHHGLSLLLHWLWTGCYGFNHKPSHSILFKKFFDVENIKNLIWKLGSSGTPRDCGGWSVFSQHARWGFWSIIVYSRVRVVFIQMSSEMMISDLIRVKCFIFNLYWLGSYGWQNDNIECLFSLCVYVMGAGEMFGCQNGASPLLVGVSMRQLFNGSARDSHRSIATKCQCYRHFMQ